MRISFNNNPFIFVLFIITVFLGVVFTAKSASVLFVHQGGTATSSVSTFNPRAQAWEVETFITKRLYSTSTVLTIGSLENNAINFVTTATSTFDSGLIVAAGGIDINLPSCDSLDTDANGAIVCGVDDGGAASVFAWTHTAGTNINATSSIIALNSGFYSVGSSTIHGNATTTGSLYVGSIIKQNSTGTSTFGGGITANNLTFSLPSCNTASKLITDSSGAITCALEALDGVYTGTYDGNNFAGGAVGVGEVLYGGSAGSVAELAAGTRGTILSMTTGGIPGWVSTSTFAHLNANNVYTGSGTTTLRNNEAFFGKIAIGGTSTSTIRGGATSSFSGGVNVLTGGIQLSLLSCTEALETNIDGAIVCGTDATGGGFSYPFNHNATYNSTSTILGFTDGFFSSGASSTISDNLKLDGLLNASSTVRITGTTTIHKDARLYVGEIDTTQVNNGPTSAGGFGNVVFSCTSCGTTGGNALGIAGFGGGVVGVNTFSARGTVTNPSASQSGDALYFMGAKGFGTNAWNGSSKAVIQFVASQNYSNTANGTYITFETTPDDSTTRAENARLNSDGYFGFGTTSPWGKASVEQVAGKTFLKPIFVISDTGTSSPFVFVNQKGGVSFGVASTTGINMNNGNVHVNKVLTTGELVATSTVYMQGLTSATGGTNNDVCVSTAGLVINETTGTCVVSSRRYKHDIVDATFPALEMISKMRSVEYSPNDDDVSDYQNTQYGFIAEEVAEVDPHLAKYGMDGLPRTLDDRSILSVVVKAIQELWKKVTGNEERINALENKNAELLRRIELLEAR